MSTNQFHIVFVYCPLSIASISSSYQKFAKEVSRYKGRRRKETLDSGASISTFFTAIHSSAYACLPELGYLKHLSRVTQ